MKCYNGDMEISDLSTKALGDMGERIAVNYIRRLGWLLVAQNWRCEYGEIDLIADDDISLIFY